VHDNIKIPFYHRVTFRCVTLSSGAYFRRRHGHHAGDAIYEQSAYRETLNEFASVVYYMYLSIRF